MSNNKIVFCDTGFVIRLLDRTSDLHENALGYFRYFLENDYLIRGDNTYRMEIVP